MKNINSTYRSKFIVLFGHVLLLLLVALVLIKPVESFIDNCVNDKMEFSADSMEKDSDIDTESEDSEEDSESDNEEEKLKEQNGLFYSRTYLLADKEDIFCMHLTYASMNNTCVLVPPPERYI